MSRVGNSQIVSENSYHTFKLQLRSKKLGMGATCTSYFEV